MRELGSEQSDRIKMKKYERGWVISVECGGTIFVEEKFLFHSLHDGLEWLQENINEEEKFTYHREEGSS